MNTISTLMRHLAERNGIADATAPQSVEERVEGLEAQNAELLEALRLLLNGVTDDGEE